MNLLGLITSKLTGIHCSGNGSEIEVTVDYREASNAERLADQVKELYDRGMLLKAIAKELCISRPLALKSLRTWFIQRGLELPPDGRTRRAHLSIKHVQAIADEVKRRRTTANS